MLVFEYLIVFSFVLFEIIGGQNKIFKASSPEITKNFQSRSAKLRFAVRNQNAFLYPNELFEKFS